MFVIEGALGSSTLDCRPTLATPMEVASSLSWLKALGSVVVELSLVLAVALGSSTLETRIPALVEESCIMGTIQQAFYDDLHTHAHAGKHARTHVRTHARSLARTHARTHARARTHAHTYTRAHSHTVTQSHAESRGITQSHTETRRITQSHS